MNAAAQGPWLDRPLASAFLAFNLLPTEWMHVSRAAPWRVNADESERSLGHGAAALGDGKRLLRHASVSMRRAFAPDEATVSGFGDPALPVFMASREGFERLARFCGLLLLSPSIRKIITRDELLALRAQLSPDELDFARVRATRLWPGDPSANVAVTLGHIHAQAGGLGQELLFLAADQASPAVACRARLRFPEDMQRASFQVPPVLQQGAQALALVRSVLQELDPEWLSLFPACP